MLLITLYFCFYVYISRGFIYKTKKHNGTSTHLNKNSNLKICSGSDANFADYPYMVPIYDNSGFCFCSGSILKKGNANEVGVILTAAHCLSNSMRNGRICVGCTKWTSPHDDPGAVMYQINYFAIHPQYDDYEFSFDVGLIYLTGPIIDPIGIDSIEVNVCSTPVSNNAAVRIQGYGTTETPQSPQLQQGQVNFIDLQTCDDIYDQAGYIDWIFASMQCMTNQGYNNAAQTDCYGDSGSPVMQLNTYNAIGIVSWGVDTGGSGCCPTDMPSVITDLCYSVITNWVNSA